MIKKQTNAKVLVCFIMSVMFFICGSVEAKSYELDVYEAISLEMPMVDVQITGNNVTVGKCTLKIDDIVRHESEINYDTIIFIKTKCL